MAQTQFKFLSINHDEQTTIEHIRVHSPIVKCNLKQAQWEKVI